MRKQLRLFLCAVAILWMNVAGADVLPPLEVSLDAAGSWGASDNVVNVKISASVPSYGGREARLKLVLKADGVARILGEHSWTISPLTPNHAYQINASLGLSGVGPGHARVEASTEDAAGHPLWGRADDLFFSRTASDVLLGKSSQLELDRLRLERDHANGAVGDKEYRNRLDNLLQGKSPESEPREQPQPHSMLPRATFTTVTISGTASYAQRTGVDAAGSNIYATADKARPITGATVTFGDYDNSTGAFIPLASTPATVVTDSSGKYSATVAGTRSDGSAVQVRVTLDSSSSAAIIGPKGVGADATKHYVLNSLKTTLDAASKTIDFPVSVSNNGYNALAIFSLREGIQTAFDFVTANNARTGVGVNPAQIFIEFPGDNANGSFFSPTGGDHINIGLNHGLDWDVYTHEYGHYVQKLNGTTQNPGGSHTICNNATGLTQKSGRVLTKDQGIKLAWGEGWPTFFGTNMQIASGAGAFGIYTVGDTVYTDTANKFHYDLENDTDLCPGAGEDSELSVQRILWDFADSPSDAHDEITFGTDLMWQQLNGTSKPVTLDQFRVLFNGLVPPTANSEYDTGTPAQNQIKYGRIYFDHNIGPEPLTPADNAASAAPPMFSWKTKGAGFNPAAAGASYHFNKFNVVFFNKDYSKVVFTSPEIPTAAGAVSADGLSANWTPTADQWTTITGGDALVHWVVQGSNDAAPATGPYYGLDRTIGGLSVIFVIDDTGSMSDDIEGVRQGLTNFITDLKAVTPPAKPLIEVITFEDTVHRLIVSNDLDQIQAVVNGLSAGGGGDCPESSAEALYEALTDLPSGAGVGKIIFATDASPHPGYSLDGIETLIRSKGIGITELLTGDCDPDGGITGMSSATARVVAPWLPSVSPQRSQNPGYAALQRKAIGPAWPDDVECPTCTPSIDVGAFMSPNTLKILGDPSLIVPSSVASFSAIANSSGKGELLFMPQVKSGDLTTYSSAVTNAALGAVVPTVIAASPSVGYPGGSMDLSLTGGNTNFASNSSVSFSGAGITVNKVTAVSATQLVVNITLAGGAPAGQRDVTVSTPLGGSTEVTKGGGQFQVGTTSAPVLESILPSQAAVGTTGTLTVNGAGTHFDATSTVSVVDPNASDPGVTVGTITVAGPTKLTVSLTVAPGAAVGFRNFTVNTGTESAALGGGGLLVVASIAPPPALAVLSSITPSSAAQGSSLDLTVVGSSTHFIDGTTVGSFSGSGITVTSTKVTSPTQAMVHVNIDPAAALGFRDMLMTTSGETAVAISGFSVTAGAVAPTVSIAASPGTITAGDSATLTWSSNNATSCTASGAWTGAEPTSGSQAVNPSMPGTYTYTLACTGSGGTGSSSTQLVVNAAPLPPLSSNSGGAAGPGLLGALSALAWLRRARKRRLALAALACAAATPSAQALKLDNVLLGFRAGAFQSNIGSGGLARNLRAKGYDVQPVAPGNGAAETAYIGYSPIGHLDLVLSYTHTDDVKVRFAGTSPPSVPQLMHDITGFVTGYGGDVYGLSVQIPGEVLPRLSVQPRFGIFLVSTHVVLDSGALRVDETHQRGGISLGAGLQYRVWRGLSLGGGVDYYRSAGDRRFFAEEGEVQWRFGQ